MKALIHIGMPKVGSSSIQEFLQLNREALAGRGIRYARFDDRLGSQFELAATGVVGAEGTIRDAPARLTLGLKTPADEAAYVAAYRAFLDRQLALWSEDLFVASSEHIQPWLHSPPQIAALDRFLSDRFDSVRYVIYLRDQPSLLLSSYSERIRRGEVLSFEHHLDNRLKALNLNQIVQKWEKALGVDRLDVRLLTRDALVGGDLLADFCAAMGTDRAGLVEPPRMNTALSSDEIALRRWLNRWLRVQRASDGRHSPLYALALASLKRLTRCGTAPMSLSEAERARIEDYHRIPNERLRARRFPDRESLF